MSSVLIPLDQEILTIRLFTATHCSTHRQHTPATHRVCMCIFKSIMSSGNNPFQSTHPDYPMCYRILLQHTAQLCNTLLHIPHYTATHCNTLQYTHPDYLQSWNAYMVFYSVLQCVAVCCSRCHMSHLLSLDSLFRTCYSVGLTRPSVYKHTAPHCNTLQHRFESSNPTNLRRLIAVCCSRCCISPLPSPDSVLQYVAACCRYDHTLFRRLK